MIREVEPRSIKKDRDQEHLIEEMWTKAGYEGTFHENRKRIELDLLTNRTIYELGTVEGNRNVRRQDLPAAIPATMQEDYDRAHMRSFTVRAVLEPESMIEDLRGMLKATLLQMVGLAAMERLAPFGSPLNVSCGLLYGSLLFTLSEFKRAIADMERQQSLRSYWQNPMEPFSDDRWEDIPF